MPHPMAKKRPWQSAARGRRSDSRRTTLTLPTPLLKQAERLAQQRRQTLSAVVAELVEQGLRETEQGPERAARILEIWKQAFVPANEEERLLLEGIVMEDPA